MQTLAGVLVLLAVWTTGCLDGDGEQRDECPEGSYLSVEGDCIREPAQSDVVPDGATARCNDGRYSYSQNRQGTCSQQGGVDVWDL